MTEAERIVELEKVILALYRFAPDNAELLDFLSRVLHEALRESDPQAYMDDFHLEGDVDGKTTIDGRFNLRAVSCSVISDLALWLRQPVGTPP